MRATTLAVAPALAFTLGMAAPAASPAKSPAPEMQASGPPENCVQIRSIRETKVIDDKTIDFILRDGRVLRNSLPMSCAQLGFNQAFGYSTSIPQLCSVDIITVIQQGGPLRAGARCGLGKFTPVAPVSAATPAN